MLSRSRWGRVASCLLVALTLPLTLAADTAVAVPTDRVLVAGGDISPDPDYPHLGGQHDVAVADLIGPLKPNVVAPLGDIQYEFGYLSDYLNAEGYVKSWGRRSIRDRSCPVTGNHDYWNNPDATGFFIFFKHRLTECATAGRPDRGYYAYNLGTWRVYALSSDCGRKPGSPSCARNSPQVEWLERDLAAHRNRCVLAYWHHPRWGQDTNDGAVQWLWRAMWREHADLVLVGHEHNYSRMGALTWDGKPASRGLRQITVGTGGRSANRFDGPRRAGTRFRAWGHFGVLKLTLRSGGYAASFRTIKGRVLDGHSAGCWA